MHKLYASLILLLSIFVPYLAHAQQVLPKPFFYWTPDSTYIDYQYIDSTHCINRLNNSSGQIKNINGYKALAFGQAKGLLEATLYPKNMFIAGFMVVKAPKQAGSQHLFQYNIDTNYFYQFATQHLNINQQQRPLVDSSMQEVAIHAFYTPIVLDVLEDDPNDSNQVAARSIAIQLLGNDSLPFNGEIAAIYLFNQKLNGREIAMLNSKLAISYGITLFQSNYTGIDLANTWNYPSNTEYHHNLDGIGRSDSLGLLHLQSQSTNLGNLPRIALTKWLDELDTIHRYMPNEHYFIFGQTSQTLSQRLQLSTQADTQVHAFAPIWRMQLHGDSISQLQTSLYFDSIYHVPNSQYTLYVCNDSVFDYQLLPTYQAYQADSLAFHHSGNLQFNNILWGTNQSKINHFVLTVTTIGNLQKADIGDENSILDNLQTLSSHAPSMLVETNSNQKNESNSFNNPNGIGAGLSIQVFPNPSLIEQTQICITTSTTEKVYLSITNMLGQVVYRTNLSGETSYTLHQLPLSAGQYIATVVQDQTNAVRKFQINKD